jgi:enterochelin esterase-like enzyme
MNMRYPIFLVLWLISAGAALAQSGTVMDNLKAPSKLLQRDQEYAIYLPPGYQESQRSYPVLFLLHGSGDDHAGWVQFGEVQHLTDQAIREGKATPMVIIMPNGKPGKSSFFNGYKKEWPYEDFFFQEFLPYLEKTYRIKQEKRYRAISGLSMGGRSAFVYGLHHPDMFAAVCPLSPGAGAVEPEKARDFYGPRGLEKANDQEITAYDQQHSILRLVETLPEDQLKSVKWYLDCGDDDGLSVENALVHVALKKKGIPHEFRVRNGGHNWTYWREALPQVLEFVTASFHK